MSPRSRRRSSRVDTPRRRASSPVRSSVTAVEGAGGAGTSGSAGSGRPARYRIVADAQFLREDGDGPDRDCWCHATRAVERALAPLTIQGIHLQRDQTREFLALKPE